MRKLFILLLSIASLSGFASDQAHGPLGERFLGNEIHEAGSYYEALRVIFLKGTKPELEKLTGIAWSGRCFRRSEPNIPIGTTSLFRISDPTDVGPLGAGKKYYEALAFLWNARAVPVNYGDDKSYQWIIDFINRKTSGTWFFYPIKDLDEAIEFDFSKFKVSGSYLVVEVYSPGANTPHMSCYYFKPQYGTK